MYRMLDDHINETKEVADRIGFPFQSIKPYQRKYFFEMVSYYKVRYDRIESDISSLTDGAQAIMTTLWVNMKAGTGQVI